MAAPLNLPGIYTGAALGPGASAKLGQTMAGEGWVADQVRANLLQTGVATGKIDPKSLSPTDTNLLQHAVTAGFPGGAGALKGGGGAGQLGGLGGAISTALGWGLSNSEDFVGGLLSLPAGAWELNKSIVSSIESPIAKATGIPLEPHYTLPQIAQGMKNQYIHDFTNLSPGHIVNPLLDVGGVLAGGEGIAARLGRVASVADAAEAGNVAAKALVKVGARAGARPAVPLLPPEFYEQAGLQPMTIPGGHYSTSPFRRITFELPTQAVINSMPGPLGDRLRGLRASGLLKSQYDVKQGRVSSYAVSQLERATQGINEAVRQLYKESGYSQVATQRKFDAAALGMIHGAQNMTPVERLELLSQWRERTLYNKDILDQYRENINYKRFNQYFRDLTNSKEYREYFSEPTDAMKAVQDEIVKSNIEAQRAIGFDPEENMYRSLAPMAWTFNETPEETLARQPEVVQNQTNFAVWATRLQKEIEANSGGPADEEYRASTVAKMLPGATPLVQKTQLVRDAIQSYRDDIFGNYTKRQLLNNADHTGYLQGGTIGQKIAVGLVDRFNVPVEEARFYATGGLTNYFPSHSAMHLNIRPAETKIGRMMGRAERGDMLSEFKFRRVSPVRLIHHRELGVAPFADFMHEADMTHFKSGVELRSPEAFVRHLQQMHRVIAHNLLSVPMNERMAIKTGTGEYLTAASDADLAARFGPDFARTHRVMPMEMIQRDAYGMLEVGSELSQLIKQTGGKVTPEFESEAGQAMSETAQQTARDMTGAIAETRGQMHVYPVEYYNRVVQQLQILERPRLAGRLWQGFINNWRHLVLAYMPSWAIRTSMGHGWLLFLSGVWNPAHYIRAMTTFKDGFQINREGTFGEMFGADQFVPGVEQGSPHADVGLQMKVGLNAFADKNMHFVHNVMNLQRRAAFNLMLNKVTRQRILELEDSMRQSLPRGFTQGFSNLTPEDVDKIIANEPDFVHHALNELDRISYTFGQMSPWERKIAKNLVPFYGWYKFVTMFAYRLPITYPGRASLLLRLGQLGQQGQDRLGPIPDWLRSAIITGSTNLGGVKYLSTLGLNPLGDIASPIGGVNGLIRLGQLSPIIQAGIEAMGINTLTGAPEQISPYSHIREINGTYYNTITGQQYSNVAEASVAADLERFVGGLMRGFPEVRLGEQYITGGQKLYPESIPFINEKPQALPAGESPTSVSPGSMALQLLGLDYNKEYGLQHHQITVLKNLARARAANLRDIAKLRSQGIGP